jgi:hypothetical protein
MIKTQSNKNSIVLVYIDHFFGPPADVLVRLGTLIDSNLKFLAVGAFVNGLAGDEAVALATATGSGSKIGN